MLGVKHDSGKLKYSLLPFSSLSSVVEVLMFGEQKYAKDNWKDVADPKTRYFDAAMRHLIQWKEGETLDKESKLPHLAHATCCLLFLLFFDKK